MKPEYLFVYGTLRADSGTPQAARLAHEAAWLGRAHTMGRLLQVQYYPGLVPEPGRAIGDAYRLDTPAPTLRWLDRYEGPEFRREVRAVRLVSGDGLDAWVYRYTGPVEGLPSVPGNDFLQSGNRQGP